ncbi:MAG: lipopolysaccharide transport periplasmic protein LptA [Betaproteobacteria bacterium]|nr:lipopolysaccharide transport periplasmic protein LptA [Betaproteobacteria bacterium]
MNARAESTILALLALLAFSFPAWAERADRDKPIQIEADKLKVDDARKTSVYEGHVVLTQGTLMITAQRVDIRQDDQGMTSGEAQGKPAYFRQRMDAKPGAKADAAGEYVEGWAERIEYDGRGDKLKLVGQARLLRGEDELRGNLITYDGVTGHYQAQGGVGGAPGRVRAVIRPKSNPADKP